MKTFWIAAGLSLALVTTARGWTAEVKAQTSDAQSKAEKKEYLRITRDAAGRPQALETSIVRFVPRDCGKTAPTVDLVAAVHVADKAYYQRLNELFEGYDAVLYELVAPEGTKIPEGGRRTGGNNPVSSIQLGMKDLLELEFQLQAVHYQRPNMVHADMSPQEFSQSMKDRGESIWGMFWRMLGYSIAKQGGKEGASDFDLIAALFDKNRALALKRILAEQFQDMEGSMLALEGPQGSTLISKRNQKALEVLRQQIAAGKKKLAIFYGAAHMSNFEAQLRQQFDLVPIETRWLPAWNLREKTARRR